MYYLCYVSNCTKLRLKRLETFSTVDVDFHYDVIKKVNPNSRPFEKVGSMIISLSLNITMNRLGGASVIAIFTTRRSHGYVNTTTWLGISQFFLFLAPNFNILTTENRSRCNRDLN